MIHLFQQSNQSIDDSIRENEKRLSELETRIAQLDLDCAELFAELAVEPSQIKAYVEEPSHFSPNNWEQLQQQRTTLEERLQRELDNVVDPSKTQRTYATRRAAQHWLFVK